MTESLNSVSVISRYWPSGYEVPTEMPERARSYMLQAIQSQHAPAGALMLIASTVDSMLKDKGYSTGSLYSRIKKAEEDHLITPEMATWAHEIRLDANDQRHADEEQTLPTDEDAQRCIAFLQALVQFVYVLPAMVTRGRTVS